MPTLEEFFEEAIEQADPENMVDKEFKYVPQIIFFHNSACSGVYSKHILM